MEFFLSNRQYTIPYRIYGTGPRALLAFHGFGRTGEDFRIFERQLGGVFTIYAFDLPYHGEALVKDISKNTPFHFPHSYLSTLWREGKRSVFRVAREIPAEKSDIALSTSQREGKTSVSENAHEIPVTNPAFTKEHLHDLIKQFCQERKIDRFSLIGYSLGGKIALGCLEVFKGRVENIYLLAPDGLKVNPFYFIGTRTWIGRSIFKSIIKKPQLLFSLGNFLERTKLINAKLNYFVKHHMDTEPKRQMVFDVWILFRKFIPNLHKITDIINENETGLIMFFGKYDNVIKPSLANKLLPRLKNKEVLHILNCGHRVMERGEEIYKYHFGEILNEYSHVIRIGLCLKGF